MDEAASEQESGKQYDEYYAKYWRLVHKYTRERLGDDAAHDAVVDIFVRVWEHRAEYDPAKGPFEHYLMRITRYYCIDIWRKQKRNLKTLAEDISDLEKPPTVDPADVAFFDGVRTSDLAGCMARLDANLRSVVYLKHVDGETWEAISENLDIPVGKLRGIMLRAIRSLKACLEAKGYPH